MTKLSVDLRDASGKGLRILRRRGFVPGVIYGHGVNNLNVEVETKALTKVYRQVGETTLFDLAVGKTEPVKVLIQEVQRSPVSGQILHVDFHQIRMDEKLEVDVPLKFVGESSAVKELGGILVRAVLETKVRCLPNDLVHEIEVDLSPLAQFNDVITLSQIKLPPAIEVISPEASEVVVTVTPPRSEAELAEIKTEVKEDIEAVKVEEKGKVEDEGVEEKQDKEGTDKGKKS
jgi:large subunit ribosomal protein L25